MMKLGAIPIAGSLAGCVGGGDGDDGGDGTGTDDGSFDDDAEQVDPSDLEGVHVEGQSLRIPIDDDLSTATCLWWYDNRWHDIDSNLEPANDVLRVVTESGLAGRWYNSMYYEEPGQILYQLYDEFEITPETIEFKIRDDAYWSDGEPVTARDAYANMATTVGGYLPFEQDDGYTWDPDLSAGYIPSINEAELPNGEDGKEVIYHVQPDWIEQGGFEAFEPGVWYYQVGMKYGYFGIDGCPQHIEPYKTMGDEAIEFFEEKPTDPSELEEGTYGHNARVERHVTPEILEDFREGENIVTCGAWTVDEIRGSEEVVLVPNEHHRHYDSLNFDEVILEYSQAEERTIASLGSGRFDYAQANVRPQVSETFSDSYEQVTTPDTYGYGIGINHGSVFGDWRVRHAVMYAVNTEDISENLHPDATSPVLTPGYDMWGADDVIDEEWAEENLITYEQDLDKAESLMQEAGLERNSDGVWEYEGEPLEFTLPTAEQVVTVEETFASQLTQFGIPVDVKTFDEATHSERIQGSPDPTYIEEEYGGSGPYDMWSFDAQVYGFAGDFNHMWSDFYRGITDAGTVRNRNWFDHETQEELISNYYSDSGDLEDRRGWIDATIDHPPWGEEDGELTESFNAAYLGGVVPFADARVVSTFDETEHYNPPDDEPSKANAEYWYKQWAWFTNWFLPVWPLVLNEQQHFINDENWLWPYELEGEDNQYIWDYFGLYYADHLAPQSRIRADPENPKDDAEVVED